MPNNNALLREIEASMEESLDKLRLGVMRTFLKEQGIGEFPSVTNLHFLAINILQHAEDNYRMYGNVRRTRNGLSFQMLIENIVVFSVEEEALIITGVEKSIIVRLRIEAAMKYIIWLRNNGPGNFLHPKPKSLLK